MTAHETELRQSIIDACRGMNASGLNQGTSGNISLRVGDVMLITPSGVPYEKLEPAMIAALPLGGKGAYEGPMKPSSEWRFHLDILNARPDIGAVVHTHSTYATALAIAGREIPACHYMIAATGGPVVRCADYATYGTQELSDAVLQALDGRLACLMANHGMLAAGADLAKAMWLAEELETLARQYYLALPLGPQILPDAEIERVREKFKGYGLSAQTAAD
ncbi:class II aldolase/adducin family protein [Stappia taiwanensis]|uniref:Class II aldolase/adducin family protein n=1 Tax=Stappia taiwanensis TaxID=992267 RepID=A0A838XVP6_9HYPH|nr:class II aldolase/adducin family protein [Stappia taiwanensis]MBA4612566.1 class II aldolase/adducin family protein [Stappia taiwanensis]GGE89470.1 fructose-bisphosphate aldolase [Stappia taiwanensis]